MKELKKDLFECLLDPDVDAICITTNGQYTMQGIACMGGGCAGECARRYPESAKRLGRLLKITKSNLPFVIGAVNQNAEWLDPTIDVVDNKKYKSLIFSFPTINNLMDGANLALVEQSARIMTHYADKYQLKEIVLGRPGVGIGGLVWVDVKPALESIFDDRFIIVSFEHEE